MQRKEIMHKGYKMVVFEGSERAAKDTIDELDSDTHFYSRLECAERTVYDIGAFYGESAVYFLRRGAARVIAVEPFAQAELIHENVRLNGIDPNRVSVYRNFLGSENGEINMDIDAVGTPSSSIKEAGRGGVSMRILTLDEILDRYRTLGEIALKIDCEGGEFPALINSELRGVKSIAAETHNAEEHNIIIERLSYMGYEVKSESDKYISANR